MDFSRYNNNLNDLKKDIEAGEENSKKFEEIIPGTDEISIESLAVKETKSGDSLMLSTCMKILDGKYKNVRINLSGEIIVEDKNGEYISAENLSIGTIDQLYLSLRMSMVEEISKEKMPIILDEAFAYYDDERLENILKYLIERFNNHQLIIFTCTNREKNILDKIDVSYN